MTNNFNGGDSYSAPPLDSYAPGKYAPSFMAQKPQPQPRPQPPPTLPSKVYLPQRPSLPPRPLPPPQYAPPVPMKLLRPQGPPISFRPQGPPPPQFNHAQSIANGYSSGQSHQSQQSFGQSHSQSQGQSHSQSLHSPNPIRQQPKYPLPYRAPVPQGLFQSIGQHVQALDNGGARHQQLGNTYLPPATNELPMPPIKLIVPNPGQAQQFLSQHQSHGSGSASSSSSFNFQNQELRNVHIIHDCGKGPQLSQNYGTPLGQPLESYQAPAQSYDVPSGALNVPQHNSIDFNSPSNSYGPPASGPASLDVLGLESHQRANIAGFTNQQHESSAFASEQQNIIDAGINTEVNGQTLPGLENGLTGSGLNFISAEKSHSIQIPTHNQQSSGQNFQLQFTTSHSDHSGNKVDSPNHQQILADGLLQSILSAIEKKPEQNVPQVTEEDQEHDHSEVQVFLTSPQGQEALADKPAATLVENHTK